MASRDAARSAVAKAIREGRLMRPDRCSNCAGGGKIEAHHPDYDQPLLVEWLCVACHHRQHRGPRGPLKTQAMAPSGFLTVTMTAARFGVSTDTVRRLLKQRKLTPYVRPFNRTTLVRIDQAERALGFERVSGPEPGEEK